MADLKTIVFGLENGLSPQDPALIASIEKNAKDFANAIEQGAAAMTDLQKIRQRDCGRWSYFWQQEHYFKQYGGSYDCDNCKCANHSFLSYPVCNYPANYWNDSNSYEKNNWCLGKLDDKYCQATPESLGVNSCSVAGNCNGICDCCSNKGNCGGQRANLEEAVSPKCYVYIPDCEAVENYKKNSQKTMNNCLAASDPCWDQKRAWAECLATQSASQCLGQATAKDYCLAHPCESEINTYNGYVSWAKTCWEQRAAYTQAEIDGAEAANKAASLEYNTLYNFFSIWQGTFGGITDLEKVKDKNPADYNYYKNKSGYKALKDIEGLILALQVVWQDDLTTVEAQDRLARSLDSLGWVECRGYWLAYPTWCSGAIVKHNWWQLDQILTIWQTVRRSSLQTAADSAARPAKDYAASIISSKIIAQEIANKIYMLRFIFEGWPGYPMNSPEVMEAKINSDLSYLPADQKATLMEIIKAFKVFHDTIKTEVIDALDNAIGQYADPNSPTACSAGISNKGFLNRVACFEHCGGLPLEQCLKPDAVIKPHQFDELMQPLSAIESIEDAIFLLTDAEIDVNKISSIQESVDNLQPEIQAQNVVSINTNFFNDFNAKVSGAIKGIFNRYNPEKSGGKNCNEGETCPDDQGPVKPLSLFGSSDGQPADFKDFANSLADNPLKFLEGQFTNIEEQFQTIKSRLEYTGSWLSNLYNDTRGGQYSQMTNEVRGAKMDELNLKINGNQSLTGACSALGIILQGDITEMNRVCSQKADGGELTTDWLNQQLAEDKQTTCDIWLALADEVVDAAGIDKEIADLRKQRECAGLSCIACPNWFCTNPPNGTWGADAMKNDQYCAEKCPGGEDTQGDGYVCKNNIIWSTSQQSSQVSENDAVKPAVCEQAGLTVSCKVSDLQTKCSDFTNKVKVEVFDKYTSEQVANTQKIQQLQSDLTCVAYENCAYGYDKNFFPGQIKTTLVGGKEQPCVACPKWICVNPNNAELPYGNDAYCNEKIAEAGLIGSNVNGLSWNFNNSNKIWDATWPTGLRKWSRDTACFSSDGKTRPANVLADKYARQSGGSAANYASMNTACIVKQKELKTLLDQPIAIIVAFPWDTENWPCKTKAKCEQMASACQTLQDGNATPLSSGWSEWPPTKPPVLGGFTVGYQGAQDVCIRTQAVMTALEKVKQEIEKAAGKEAQFKPEVLAQLNIECNELKRQQELKKECDGYALTKKALANKCNSVALSEDKAICNGQRSQMSGLCALAREKNWSDKDDYCDGTHLVDLLLRSNEGDLVNEIGLQKVRSRCMQTLDIRTPLGEIMKVLSILMGIQSGTAAHSGIVSSIQGSRVFYENVGKFIKMIEGLKDAMGKAYDDTMANSVTGGFKITPFKCVAMPAESSVGGQRLTGPDGGPVCPEVGNIYSQMQADFAIIRQETANIAQTMHKNKDINVPLPWNNAYVHLFTQQIDDYPSIKPLSDRAQELRGSAQFVWAMATAINFANTNCTCGMSYCKLPFCISGLPLTLEPLKKPYCALVWMLRTPMIDLGNRLAEDLNKTLDKVK